MKRPWIACVVALGFGLLSGGAVHAQKGPGFRPGGSKPMGHPGMMKGFNPFLMKSGFNPAMMNKAGPGGKHGAGWAGGHKGWKK